MYPLFSDYTFVKVSIASAILEILFHSFFVLMSQKYSVWACYLAF